MDTTLACPPLTASRLSADEAARTAGVFKALAHPHRVQLVNLLARSGFPVCVCDLTEVLGLAQSMPVIKQSMQLSKRRMFSSSTVFTV